MPAGKRKRVLTVEVEMSDLTGDAGEKAAGPAELTRTDKVTLTVAFIAWVIVGVLVVNAVVFG
jgi:hypothetical protein